MLKIQEVPGEKPPDYVCLAKIFGLFYAYINVCMHACIKKQQQKVTSNILNKDKEKTPVTKMWGDIS